MYSCGNIVGQQMGINLPKWRIQINSIWEMNFSNEELMKLVLIIYQTILQEKTFFQTALQY